MIQELKFEDRFFLVNFREAKALYKLLQHEFIPRDGDYETLMRMLNGLANFIADCEVKNELP